MVDVEILLNVIIALRDNADDNQIVKISKVIIDYDSDLYSNCLLNEKAN